MVSRETHKIGSAEILSGWAVTVGLVVTGAILWFAWKNSYFFGDDYSVFLEARFGHFPEALLFGNGSQIVPLQRAAMFLVWRVAPLSFGVALFVLAFFHALGVLYLYKTLELIAPTRFNVVLVAWYASYVFIGVNFIWFSSGIARFPYLALTLIALYQYLAFGRTGRPWRLFVVGLSTLVAMGFYSKGILIPLYCIGLDLADGWGRPRSAARRGDGRKWFLIAVLCALGVANIWWVRHLAAGARIMNWSLSYQFEFLKNAGSVFGDSLFGEAPPQVGQSGNEIVAAVWLVPVAYSVLRLRRTLGVWAICAALIGLNVLFVGVSNRTVLFGRLMVFEYRHYFELCFLLVLFSAIVFRELRTTAPELGWLATSWRIDVVRGLLGAFLLGAAVHGYGNGVRVFRTGYDDAIQSRRYMTTLRADLDRLGITQSKDATFADGWLPAYLDELSQFRRLSQLFAVMDLQVTFLPKHRGAYAVDLDGHVARRRRRALAPRKPPVDTRP